MSNQNDASDKKKWSVPFSDTFLTSPVKQIYSVTAVDLIFVTDDKVKLWLNEHWKYVEKKYRWIAPLGISVSIVITLSTCSFQIELFGFQSAVWEAIFIIAGILAFFWLIYDLGWIISMVLRKKALNIDDMVHKLKEGSMSLKATAQPASFVLDSYFSKSNTQEDEELNIAKDRIQICLKEKLKQLSFDRVRNKIDESYTDDFLKKLLKKYPKVFRGCEIKTSQRIKPGITLTRDASQDT